MAEVIHTEPTSAVGYVVGGKDGTGAAWGVGLCELCPGKGSGPLTGLPSDDGLLVGRSKSRVVLDLSEQVKTAGSSPRAPGHRAVSSSPHGRLHRSLFLPVSLPPLLSSSLPAVLSVIFLVVFSLHLHFRLHLVTHRDREVSHPSAKPSARE